MVGASSSGDGQGKSNPPQQIHLAKKAPPPVELAKRFEFDDDISIGTLFPSLKDGPFDAINLTKSKMIWLAKDATPTMTAGLWFETDVKFRGILQPVSDILRDVFSQEDPGLHLSAHLGIADTWSDELIATGFTFRGSIEGINRGFGEFLTFRNAGIQLHVAPGKTNNSDLTSMYGFFGTLHLQVPNAITPLVLSYDLEPKEDTLDITMMFGNGERWESVFGVKGLNLDKVKFITTLVKSDIKKSLEFSINALWSLGNVPVELTGHIKKDGSSLQAYIKLLTMDDLRSLFNTLTGSHLEPLEQDIQLSDLTLEISRGRIALYGEVWVDGHQVAKAEVLVTVDGIRISGAVDDLHIGEDVHIKEAQLELIVGDIKKPEIDKNNQYRGTEEIDGSGKGKETLSTPPPPPANTEVAPTPQKKGTPVTAVIRGHVEVNTGDVHFKFKVAAAIMKKADGPVNYFVYGQLDFLLPENIRIELSPNVVSGPLVLSVETRPLKVMFAAKLWVTPDGQKEPLELTLALSADDLQAVAFAQMEGWWDNPLDLSPRLKIGPVLTLEVEVDYKQFAATGMPSGIGFQGGFLVDDIDEYLLAFNLGTNPKETLVEVKISKLDEGKIINLINAVAEVDIKRPQQEIIRFEDVNIYASPMGCMLGTKSFPPGFVVQGKAYILDKKVEIDCRIGKQGLKLKGEIEGFSLGPLTVQGGKRADGTRSPNALVDMEITKERQHFEVNGSIALWDLETSIFVLAEAMPSPQLEFNFELAWSDLLKFQVDGKLIRPAGSTEKALNNLDNADFELHAVMEQHILREISEAMQKWFKSAQVSVHEGIEEAKKKVDEAKAEFERKCAAAQENVRKAKAAFEADMEAAQSSLKQREQECEEARRENERWVLEEEKRADQQIRSANAALDARNKDFQDDLDGKKRDLSEKQREGDEAIGGAIRDLQDKRITLQRDFGSAIDSIRSARSRVEDAEWEVNRAEDRLREAKDDYDDCAWSVWDGLIAAAKTALDGVGAVHKGLIETAKLAVEAANKVALGIKQAAAAVKDGVLAANAKILAAAREVLSAVAKGISFLAFQTALEALEFAKKDTTWVTLAKGALDTAEAVAQAALAAAAWLAQRLCDTLNIERVELTSSLRKIAQGGAFTIRIAGTILGQDFDFSATWSPKDMLSFIAGLCEKLWNDFIDSAGAMFEDHKTQGKSTVENVHRADLISKT
ncbi:hypothetical protein TASIC1_0009000800 [Trichoderma asperellum]|uniref:Uncharacterized protein n=1 Tax=Trichoderma asperellum TaxID=101201 RepID=A0A6V8QY99_TRIAP|nr:hypothetical protein TASIC1_0009000800 [Trichoderma asperellum]